MLSDLGESGVRVNSDRVAVSRAEPSHGEQLPSILPVSCTERGAAVVALVVYGLAARLLTTDQAGARLLIRSEAVLKYK